MTTVKETRVTAIGHIANQVLRRSPSSMVTGLTSQGIFLQPRGDLTLYLTRDSYRGPLTINIRGEGDAFRSIQPFDVADLIEDHLEFRNAQQAIYLKKPLVWKPALPPKADQGAPTKFTSMLQKTRSYHPKHPYLPLLEMVATGETIPMGDLPGIEDWISQLSRTLGRGNPSEIIQDMDAFLGAGPGLTPLGDDILLGILLAINRSKRQQYWSGDIYNFNRSILIKADKCTTRLSWSLLSCALQGTADERIIRVLDGLIAGREIPDYDLESLLNWGSSSGIAVLAGMMMALS